MASDSTDLVRGLPADMRRVRQRRTVTWGPIDGNYWDAETNGLQNDAALEFANAVGVVDGLPAVAYGYDLGEMKPLGDVKTSPACRCWSPTSTVNRCSASSRRRWSPTKWAAPR